MHSQAAPGVLYSFPSVYYLVDELSLFSCQLWRFVMPPDAEGILFMLKSSPTLQLCTEAK